MLSLADIRQWKPAELDGVFAALGTHRDTLITLDDDLIGARHPAGWTGAAAEAATADFDRLAERMRRIVAAVAGVRRAVGDTADAVIEVQRALAEAEELAWRHSFTVDPDAAVIDVSPPEVLADQAQAVARDRAMVRAEVIGLLEQVLRRAAEIEAELTAVLNAAARFDIEDGTTTTLAGAAEAGAAAGELSELRPPQDGTPQQVADWWATLSASERAILAASRPELLGNLDGIPAQVRDEANRERLPEERAALQAQATQLQFGAYRGMGAAAAHLGLVQDKLAALESIEDTLARGDRQLLLLDTAGQRVKAAVAIGNVDTASHIAVFTPGFTSTVEGSLAGYDDQMRLLREQAQDESQRYGDGGSVAAVTWIGYEAPQWGEIANPGRSVLSEAQARTGGAALGGFLDGTDASRPDDPHLIAIGHSYGSTTTGHAVQQTDAVDDVIFFGSPGIGTSDVRDLHIPEGHSYVIEARNDPVADLGRFGDDPNQLDGLTDLSSAAARTPDGRELTEVTGHSNYLAPDTTSQHNMSVVIAGTDDRAIEGENTGHGDRAREFAGDVIGGAARKVRDIVPGV
ncbi:MAG: alpha/beta hydrolase [Pseudonocardiales bacterium]